jgi:hypothetical protein
MLLTSQQLLNDKRTCSQGVIFPCRKRIQNSEYCYCVVFITIDHFFKQLKLRVRTLNPTYSNFSIFFLIFSCFFFKNSYFFLFLLIFFSLSPECFSWVVYNLQCRISTQGGLYSIYQSPDSRRENLARFTDLDLVVSTTLFHLLCREDFQILNEQLQMRLFRCQILSNLI